MSVSTSRGSQAAILARVQALIAGTNKHFPNANITFGKATYTTAALLQLMNQLMGAITAVITAHASVTDALTALTAISASVLPILRGYEGYVRSMLGNAKQDLADFGLSPRKVPAPKTGAELAAAAAKAEATRVARGTKGKKAKLAIKGNVTGVEVTPVTTTGGATQPPLAAPAPSAQPAPTAPSAPNGTPAK